MMFPIWNIHKIYWSIHTDLYITCVHLILLSSNVVKLLWYLLKRVNSHLGCWDADYLERNCTKWKILLHTHTLINSQLVWINWEIWFEIQLHIKTCRSEITQFIDSLSSLLQKYSILITPTSCSNNKTYIFCYHV